MYTQEELIDITALRKVRLTYSMLGLVYPALGLAAYLISPQIGASGATPNPEARGSSSLGGNASNSWNLVKWQSDSERIYECSIGEMNTCAPNKPMRSLSPEEIQIIIGSDDSMEQTQTHGSCTANGCNVTATVPPPTYVSGLPITSAPPPPDMGGGGGGGYDYNVPNTVSQQHLEQCALAYGALSPSLPTKFTDVYGWTAKDADGVWVSHTTTSTIEDPPLPLGAKYWQMDDATTFLTADQNQQNHIARTEIYKHAYQSDARLVKIIAHEWYHQNHYNPNATPAQQKAEEDAADQAGQDAENGYVADGGAKCN